MKTIDAEDVWLKEVATSIKNMQQLKEKLELRKEEEITNVNLPIRITPYYLELIKKFPELRKTVVPTMDEFDVSSDEDEDPLAEDEYKKTDCVIHKYKNRVLFIVTNFCSTNCRFCTRSRMVGKEKNFTKKQWDEGIKYIADNPIIRDVIISGGDPLTLKNDKLEYLLSNLKNIPHLDIIRIGTKIPVVLPQRIDEQLIKILLKYKPIYINIHFTHKSEITNECKEAIDKLLSAGAILGSQTVLLKGINDNALVLEDLFYELLKIGIKPYYLYQMDRIKGGSHFRCDLDIMVNIMKKLVGYNSGLAIPEFIIDTQIGKIPLRLDYVTINEEGKYILTNFEKNKTIEY